MGRDVHERDSAPVFIEGHVLRTDKLKLAYARQLGVVHEAINVSGYLYWPLLVIVHLRELVKRKDEESKRTLSVLAVRHWREVIHVDYDI